MAQLKRQDRIAAAVFVAPAMIGFTIFVGIPLVSVFVLSTQSYNALSGISKFIGLDNFIRLFTDPVFYTVLVNTAVFALAVVPANVILGMLLAVLVNQRLPGMAIFRAAYFVPVVVSLVAWSLVWNLFMQNNGAINGWLGAIGLSGQNWLADPNWAMPSVIAVQVLKGVGVSMILFLAALQEVPEEQKEAAMIDGAGAIRIFFTITLPFISPTIVMVGILSTINSLKTFALIYALTGGGPGYSTSVLGYFVYDQAFNSLQIGFASAVSVILFVIALGLTVLQWWSRKKWVLHES